MLVMAGVLFEWRVDALLGVLKLMSFAKADERPPERNKVKSPTLKRRGWGTQCSDRFVRVRGI